MYCNMRSVKTTYSQVYISVSSASFVLASKKISSYCWIINQSCPTTSLLRTVFVISWSELCDSDWSNVRHAMCKNKWCCPVLSMQRHVPVASHDPYSPGTWCKPRDTMHLLWFFVSTAVLHRSICILCCCVMDNDTNLLHLFSNITKQILTVSLDQHNTNIYWCRGQHWKIMTRSCSVLIEASSQYYFCYIKKYEQ